jgi:hypothetical protein
MLPITMGCDFSHPPSYMYSMIGFGNTQSKIRRFIYNKNLGKWVELIYMGNSPLDPSLDILLDPPLSCGLIHPPSLSMSP